MFSEEIPSGVVQVTVPLEVASEEHPEAVPDDLPLAAVSAVHPAAAVHPEVPVPAEAVPDGSPESNSLTRKAEQAFRVIL